MRELLKNHHTRNDRGVTFLQLAHLADSLSSFTQVFVNAFDLRWLQLRHSLVDLLPFAGSEILVMKELFSDRDLETCLGVITSALKRNAKQHPNRPRPVIVVDGLGEERRWLDGDEGELVMQRMLRWSIHVTKEHRLAHVVLTGSEQLLMSLTDQNRVTRGHVRVVGLGDLDIIDAARIVRVELPDATDEEVKRVTDVFGGFVHDVKGASRDVRHRCCDGRGRWREEAKAGTAKRRDIINDVVRARFRQTVERVMTAFADARKESDSGGAAGSTEEEEDEMDPYLDPLKAIYSSAQAAGRASHESKERGDCASWTQLQLWKTINYLVNSPDMAVSFADLRDDVFEGSKAPILDLMGEDILSFEVRRTGSSGWFWMVTPASPAIALAFARLVEKDSFVQLFDKIEEAEKRDAEKRIIDLEGRKLLLDRKHIDLRKKSLLQTLSIGKELELDQSDVAREKLVNAFKDILREEELHDRRGRELQDRLSLLAASDDEGDAMKATAENDCHAPISNQTDAASIKSLLKSAVLDIVSAQQDAVSEEYSTLQKALFDLRTKDGKIWAKDLVDIVHSSTGRDIRLSEAEALIRDWDANNDEALDYKEFLQLLLSEDKK